MYLIDLRQKNASSHFILPNNFSEVKVIHTHCKTLEITEEYKDKSKSPVDLPCCDSCMQNYFLKKIFF